MKFPFLILAVIAVQAQQPDLAVVQKVAGSVGFYTHDGKFLTAVKVGEHPHEAVLSPDKRLLYVTDNGILWMTYKGEGGNTISIVDIKARKKVGVIDLGSSRRPHGIDVDPKTGHIVATTENPSGLVLVDPVARKVLRRYDVKGEAPHMVRLSPDARIAYVSNTNSGTLAAVNLETGEAKTIPTGARPQRHCLFARPEDHVRDQLRSQHNLHRGCRQIPSDGNNPNRQVALPPRGDA